MSPTDSSLLPSLELWIQHNPGLTSVLTTIIGGGFIVFLRKPITALFRTVWTFLCGLVKNLVRTSKRFAAWSKDVWKRLKTPLEKRDTIVAKEKEWDSERQGLESELSKFRRKTELQRQEINKLAKERDKFRDQNSSRASPVCAREHVTGSIAKDIEDRMIEVDLQVVQKDDSVFSGDWILRNWGPGSAHNLYMTTEDIETRLKNEHCKTLRPKETVLLFDTFSRFPLRHNILHPLRLRVTYDNDLGERKTVFLDLPNNPLGIWRFPFSPHICLES